MKTTHFLMVPFTGLGLFKGYRGDTWLKNRIHVFNTFVLRSLLNQTNQNFILWVCWRKEEQSNPFVKKFQTHLHDVGLKTIHTFHGIPFWDDKYKDDNLLDRLRLMLPELKDAVGSSERVLMTIQPSDDMYIENAVETLQNAEFEATGWVKGYIMNYQTKEIAEYNPTTIPPFFTISFPTDVFLNPGLHYNYIGPYESHEYIKDHLKFTKLPGRGFVVGTHGENISTTWNHSFKGRVLSDNEKDTVLIQTGNYFTEPLTLKKDRKRKVMKKILNALSPPIQKRIICLLSGNVKEAIKSYKYFNV